MTTTFCVSGAVLDKAGPNIIGERLGFVDRFINEAENVISVNSRYDFITNYSSVISAGQMILHEVASNLAAIYLIGRDISGGIRIGMEDNVNILRDGALRGLGILRDKKAQDFMTNA